MVGERRRARMVRFQLDLLSRLLRDVDQAHCPDMPEDAQIIRWFHEPSRDCITLIIESQSFEPIGLDGEVPIWNPTWLRGPRSASPGRST